MKTLKLISICPLLLNCLTAAGFQDSVNFEGLGPAGCQENEATLRAIHQKAGPDKLITVVARLGEGDVRQNLNRRRLYNVRAYWTEFLKGRDGRQPKMILLAIGERASGYGRLEFYVGGKTVEVLNVHRDRDLIVGDCYPLRGRRVRDGAFNICNVERNQIFYPCRDPNVRRRSRRQ